jgi:hypothetical protein
MAGSGTAADRATLWLPEKFFFMMSKSGWSAAS